MTNFDARDIYRSAEFQQELTLQRTFMARVYGWMTIGLLVTALTALVVSGSAPLIKLFILNRPLFYGLMIGEVGLVLAFVYLLPRISVALAATMFLVYSLVTGLTLSIVLLIYTRESVAGTFFITAGTFGAMSAFGYITKKDLSGLGSFLFMGLIGVIIASLVNLFLQSSALQWFISFIGVIVFTGLTAYDTQKIKRAYADGGSGSAANQKTALMGAFSLYLDFINLFLYLLQFLGNRRD